MSWHLRYRTRMGQDIAGGQVCHSGDIPRKKNLCDLQHADARSQRRRVHARGDVRFVANYAIIVPVNTRR